MLSTFDKEFLSKEYYELLLEFQLAGDKANLIGLIGLENCFIFNGYEEYMGITSISGWLERGLRRHAIYQQKFKEYIDILIELGDKPIYPSKEDFFKNLFINGDYSFLNFSKKINIQRFISKDDDLIQINCFQYTDFSKIDENGYKKENYYRIIKNGIMRYNYEEMTSPEHFNHVSNFLTLSLKDISDEEFYDIFKASNFLTDNLDTQTTIQTRIHNLILKMIKSGDEIEKNISNDHWAHIRNYKFYKDPNNIVIKENKKIIDNNFDLSKIKSIKYDDILSINNKNYKIIKIEKEQANEIIIKVEFIGEMH